MLFNGEEQRIPFSDMFSQQMGSVASCEFVMEAERNPD
jgi:hypothetical protein